MIPRLLILSAVIFAPSLQAQPLVRVPATSLRLGATAPAATYSTANAFPTLAFTQPVAAVTPPGETRRLFIVEKPGRIWLIHDAMAETPVRTLFLDLTPRVLVSADNNDERGLLALAFHPNFASNGEFFVWYTTSATTGAGSGLHNRLSRFRARSADPASADPDSEEPLITQRDEANNHNGGELAFGGDGYLYLSLGDEGGGNDQYQNSQRIDRDFFAGIIRLDVDRAPGSLAPNPHPAVHSGSYRVPPDNPWVGATSFNGATVNAAAVRTEFWAVGLRNPWRMAFDAATGQLWCADVGQGAREEINLIVRGGNYGWDYREGRLRGPDDNAPAGVAFHEPIWDYDRARGASVTGGIVYRGTRYGELSGRYLFADFVSGNIWSLPPEGENAVPADRVQLLATDVGISSFGVNPATGEILLCDLLEGAVKRLVANAGAGDAQLPATLSATGAFSQVATLTAAPGVVAYEPNASFWSDHASKRRWFALPSAAGTFGFSADGAWTLPTGAVWIKHFDLELARGDPGSARRIETRVLVKTATGTHGLTYEWNDAQTDATLVPDAGVDRSFTVVENGARRTQTWRFPSRSECSMCHTPAGGHALSFNTRQLNRDFAFPGGTANIITALAQAGYLEPAATPPAASLPALVSPADTGKPLEARARSYLDANCAQCHQPGAGAWGLFDARASTPLSLANIIHGALTENGADPANRVVVPGAPAHSRILHRMGVRGPGQMPPIGSNERDLAGEELLRRWIVALAEPSLAAPPSRLINLAARAQVGTGVNTMIPGFVIARGAEKTVIVRAIGPTLSAAPFNVPGALPDPILTLLGPDSATRIAATNDNWNAGDAATFAAAGAFALPGGSRDAAIVARLEPGAYTAQISGVGTAEGVALVEIYDADGTGVAGGQPAATTVTGSRLINTSVRAQVGTGDNILIPGVVVGPGAPKTVLVRAVGPGIAASPFNVAGVLAEPVLSLFSGSQLMATNRGWGTGFRPLEITQAAVQVGAFPLLEGTRDSALLVSLSSGAYTLQISGANSTSGVVLVEIYEVP